jgi:DNA-binding CsgD family transcriptional regulator
MRKSAFFNEFLADLGLRWWAGVGFFAGPELWCLALQRTEREGPFLPSDKPMLQGFSARLTEVASLSRAIGRKSITCFTNALDHVSQAALTIDRNGRVIRTNASAEALFDDAFRTTNRKLVFRDRQASLAYSNLLDRLRWTPEGKALKAAPIVIRRPDAWPLVLQALPVDGEEQSPFGGARALLLLREIRRQTAPATSLISQALEITPAEARLVARLASGETLVRASRALGVAHETARKQLRSVYMKTDTHSQNGLTALLASLLALP